MRHSSFRWSVFKPYIIVFAFFYFVVFPVTGITDIFGALGLLLSLVVILPLLHLVTGVIYGTKHGFTWWLFLLSALLFVPATLAVGLGIGGSVIGYLLDEGLYLLFFFILLAIGQGVGCAIRRFRHKRLSSVPASRMPMSPVG